MTRPYADKPTEGFLTFHTHLSPMASPDYLPNSAATDEAQIHLARMLERALRKSRAVDTEGLCIAAGAQVWRVRVDVHVLDADGGVADCACVAAITALQDFRRPDVTVNGDDITIVRAWQCAWQ